MIATIILIAITLVGGGLVYSFFVSTTNTYSKVGPQFMVTGSSLATQNGQLVLDIKNTGTQAISSFTFECDSIPNFDGQATNAQMNAPIQPGGAFAVLFQYNTIQAGDYTFVLVAYGSDGSSTGQSVTITAQ